MKAHPVRPWTETEAQRLIKLAAHMSLREAAAKLGRSKQSVSAFVVFLRQRNIPVNCYFRGHAYGARQLTSMEIAWLRAHAGASRKEMAQHLGVGMSKLYRELRALNLAQPDRGRWTATEDGKLREMAGALRTREIGVELGRSRNSVVARARVLGVCIETRDRWSKDQAEVAVAMARGGANAEMIAAAVGRRADSVRWKLRALGVEFKHRRGGRPAGEKKPRAERVKQVAPPARERGTLTPAASRRHVRVEGSVRYCPDCCAPVMDTPQRWAEHRARVHVAPARRVA